MRARVWRDSAEAPGTSPSGFRRRGASAIVAVAVLALLVGPVAYALSASWRQPPPKPPTPLTAARDAVHHGRYADAEKQLKSLAAADPNGDAALELALLQIMLGRKRDAVDALERIVDAPARTAAALVRSGRAAHALGEFKNANAFFQQANQLAPDDPDVNTAWGELFLEKYQRQEAAQSFQIALRKSTSARALVGSARATADENPPAARALAQRALEQDPEFVPAHLLLAELDLDEGHRPEATEAINRALEINPNSLEAHALLAAVANLEGRAADFDAEVKKSLTINPVYGEVYRVAGDHAARNYRFEEALKLTRQALALDPDNARASADIGTHLMRLGDEPAAREALERAFRADPYDVITYNLLSLLDTLDKFETFKEDGIILRLRPDEANVVKEYAMPLAKRALATLSKKYGFEPAGPILIEMFPRHDDFAVRNVGLPGMIGALGACFGKVVTLDSPRAREPGEFNWGATLWHELAHVITLQMSNQRVPRWLTEGISVYEEKQARPEWGREMELAFAQKLERNEILKLKDLNAGFTNPQTISLAYYEASLLVDHIVTTYGMAGLQKLLRTFTTGVATEDAIKTALGIDLAQLQTAFDVTLDKHFGALRRALRPIPELQNAMQSGDVERLKQLATTTPDNYLVWRALGEAQRTAGDLDGAVASLKKAAALVPMATGKQSPYAIIADIALEKHDKPLAVSQLETLLSYDGNDVDTARKLAGLIDPAESPDRALAAHTRVIEMDPFDAKSHAVVGRLALARKDAETAIREFRVVLATGPVDVAAANCDLADAYLLAGRPAEAKKATLAALEVAPSYDRAQALLLKILEGR
jgi:tetratricopeptide (TPR) repeat protein